jgi:hypothetical protein
MPSKNRHVQWAKHNRSFWTGIDLDSSPFTDWALTGMFYESLHWVEALLASKNYHSIKHSERAQNMHYFRSDFNPIQTDYDTLKQDSEAARYRCYKHTANEIQQLIPCVDSIKNHISQLL